jgi:hypothetical protein
LDVRLPECSEAALTEVKTLKDLDAFGIGHGSFALFFEPRCWMLAS